MELVSIPSLQRPTSGSASTPSCKCTITLQWWAMTRGFASSSGEKEEEEGEKEGTSLKPPAMKMEMEMKMEMKKMMIMMMIASRLLSSRCRLTPAWKEG